MRNRRAVVLFSSLLLAAWPAGGAGGPELKYVAIVSRHGVRSPTWDNAELDSYTAQPWPKWDVPPGNLTAHGRQLIELMGAYYREWLTAEHLLNGGCQDASRIYIDADKGQRTLETGRALAESLAPGCGVEVHGQPAGKSDPLFSGFGTANGERARAAILDRLRTDLTKLPAKHRAALDELQAIVRYNRAPSDDMMVVFEGDAFGLRGPFTTGSTFSENLLLEYANGMRGDDLGWGRLTRENLERILEVHTVYADIMRRTPYLARARGSNLLAHVLHSLEQAATGKPVAGALGKPGDALLVLAGHDTNLSNLSGMLGLSWKLAGYQPDDTPPGGALIFSLWRDASSGKYTVKLRYVAQSLDQMRDAQRLALASPPEGQDVALPNCDASGCAWDAAKAAIEKAIDPQFVAKP